MGKQAENEVIYVEGIILEEGTDAKEEKLSKPKGAARMAKGIASFAKDVAVKRVAPKIQDAAGQAADEIQEKAIPLARKGIEAAQEKADALILEAKMKYYNSVSESDLASPDFHFPKLIEIVDPCDKHPFLEEQNACGWLSREAGLQVLHIFDGEMTECGLTFHPFVATDSFYYVDATNPSRYINLSNYYDTIRAEKEAELQKIAYDLGAKRCMLECEQASISIRSKQWAAKGKAKASPTEQAGIDATCAINQESKAKRHALFVQEYEGNPEPNEPELHWYRNDPCIEQLIRSRCSGEGKALVTHYERQISTHSSMAIDINAAAKIDAALERMNASANVSFKGKAKDEAREKLTFIVDF